MRLTTIFALFASFSCMGSYDIPPPQDPERYVVLLDDVDGASYTVLENGNPVLVNEYGCPHIWEAKAFPLQVVVNEELPVDILIAITDGANRWNASVPGGGVLELVYVPADDKRLEVADFRDIRVVLDKVPQADEDDEYITVGMAKNYFLARAFNQAGLHSSRVLLADDLIGIDLEVVTTHEIGHSLGFYHDDENFSVMQGVMDLQTSVIDDRDALRLKQMRDGTLTSPCFN